MAQAPDTPEPTDVIDPADLIQAQVDQLTSEIEQLQERLMDLYAKLSLMENQARAIRRNIRRASVYRRRR
jgi:prefoldin subunit 5